MQPPPLVESCRGMRVSSDAQHRLIAGPQDAAGTTPRLSHAGAPPFLGVEDLLPAAPRSPGRRTRFSGHLAPESGSRDTCNPPPSVWLRGTTVLRRDILMSSTVPVPDSILTPDEVVQLLRALGPRIPEFVLMPTSEAVALARAASTDIAQINSAIDAIAASTNLSAALGSDAAVLRSESEVTNRWSQVL